MKTIKELLDEVQSRTTVTDRGMPVDVRAMWDTANTLEDKFTNGYVILLSSHVNLLRVVVCINERAIDGWVHGLQDILEIMHESL